MAQVVDKFSWKCSPSVGGEEKLFKRQHWTAVLERERLAVWESIVEVRCCWRPEHLLMHKKASGWPQALAGGGGAEAKVRLHMLPCLPRDGEDVGKFWAMAANRAGERAPVAFSPTCTRWTPVTSVYCSWNPKYDFCIQNTVHIKTCTGIFMQNYSW